MHLELSQAARRAFDAHYKNLYSICYENTPFTPPVNGQPWLKFDYIEADTLRFGLRRTCKSWIGMVQISINFPTGIGMDWSRGLAKDIATFFDDDKMLSTGYVYIGGEVHPVQKSVGGWMLPVRFYVRFDGA